jgi:release factor glutamine methyltransferase
MIDIYNAYRQATNELNPIWGASEAQSIARIVVAKVSNLKPHEISLSKNFCLMPNQLLKLNKYLKDLKQQKPIQYVLGETEFYGMTLNVNPSVLIPRPETEELVQWVISESKGANRFLDIGTGSGCISIALSRAFPSATVVATDISHLAIEVAQGNALLNYVNVEFLLNDVFSSNLFEIPHQPFDVIVSNPPYVRESEREEMHPNVLEFEPELALFVSDSNPLRYYKRIGEAALVLLSENGQLFCEINEALGPETKMLFENIGFVGVTLNKDINGKDRMIKASLK